VSARCAQWYRNAAAGRCAADLRTEGTQLSGVGKQLGANRLAAVAAARGVADLPQPVAVCCHDAGAANIVAAWVAAQPLLPYRICAVGPARAIFAGAAPHYASQSLPDALAGAACLLSGSGWASDLEHEARLLAHHRGVPSLAVLDHWVNYHGRFVRDGVEAWPDVFVVTDPAASALTRECFGAARPIITWPNDYLQREAARVRALAAAAPTSPPVRLLVVLEPVRADWERHSTTIAEFRALDYLMAHLAALTPDPTRLAIRLRPHPSETAAKYQPWIALGRHVQLTLTSDSDLASDLAWADAVAGLNSYALVVARAAGRRAVSYLPPQAPPCVLRYPGIEELRQLPGGGA
jgi:hypothetical protein